jgi:hypothetical protein
MKEYGAPVEYNEMETPRYSVKYLSECHPVLYGMILYGIT